MENKKRIYRKKQLREAIFQVRFPTILRINNEAPVGFQESIRQEYPFYELLTEHQNEITVNTQNQPEQLTTTEVKNHTFISSNKEYKVNLTSTFLAVSTVNYNGWEAFKREIEYIVGKFVQEYTPTFFIRVGLRYINVIIRSELGLTDVHWRELLQPHLIGLMNNEDEENVGAYNLTAEYNVPESRVNIRTNYGLVNVNDSSEKSFLIDCDYYVSGQIRDEKLIEVSDVLHIHSSNVLEKSITRKLDEAMEPIEI